MTTLQEGRVLSGGDARGMAAAAVNAMSPNTLRSYRLHWSKSQDWTKARGLLDLSARPQDQASFLVGLAEAGASLSAVKLAMLSAPLGHGVQAARAAQHGAHCHGQYGSQGMTNPPGAARVGYLGQGFPQSQRNLYLPVLPSPDLRIPKNNLIVDPRLTTVQQLNDPAPSPPSRCPHAVHRCPSVDSGCGFGVRLDVPQTIHIRRSSRNSEAGLTPVTSR